MAVVTELIRARAAGARAAREGTPRNGGPYRPNAPQPRERMLWRAWHTGYESVNPMPVDYSG